MKRILIFYSQFSPAFKAGGPVQSLRNMVELIRTEFKIDIVCSARDLDDEEILPDVTPDQWNAYADNVDVLYISQSATKQIRRAFDRKPDIVFINGLFLPRYSWLPLLLSLRNKIKKIVISPRGMIQEGALAHGRWKKNIVLQGMRLFVRRKNVLWHATDEQEKKDILLHFGNDALVEIAPNAPQKPLNNHPQRKKHSNELKLVYLSLIARKKNLQLFLQILKGVSMPVSLDIFGPIKDQSYWNDCLALIRENRHHTIRYLGLVKPDQVQQTLKGYQAMVLLTRGENFGHAIYESLSAGTPVIVSPYTQWGILQDKNAGFTVDINRTESVVAVVEKLFGMEQSGYDEMSKAAFDLATSYYHSNNFKACYQKLFLGTR